MLVKNHSCYSTASVNKQLNVKRCIQTPSSLRPPPKNFQISQIAKYLFSLCTRIFFLSYKPSQKCFKSLLKEVLYVELEIIASPENFSIQILCSYSPRQHLKHWFVLGCIWKDLMAWYVSTTNGLRFRFFIRFEE